MHRGDRRLQREGTGFAAHRLVDERQRLGDLRVVPAAAILLVEHDDVARLVEARLAARVVEQHEREESRSPRSEDPGP